MSAQAHTYPTSPSYKRPMADTAEQVSDVLRNDASGTLGEASLVIRPWSDPVIDELGFDIRSHYVEQYWLGILGPSTTFLLRAIAFRFDAEPEGFNLHLADTARSLGLGPRAGKHSPFVRAIDRCCQFGLARRHLNQLDVRRRVPPLTRGQVSRLPEALQDGHQAWLDSTRVTTMDEKQAQARRLALGLLELGTPAEEVEANLWQWQYHPSIAHEALRWAQDRLALEIY